MKNKVYIFTSNYVVMKTNPENLEFWKAQPNALINPDVSGVSGIPVHLWQAHENKIVPVTEQEEIDARAESLLLNGPDRKIPEEPKIFKIKELRYAELPEKHVELAVKQVRSFVKLGAAIVLAGLLIGLLVQVLL